ncbi:YwqG family protein [Deinococcus radiophilus]|uniref:DUF1963 domain-containing protein n=1 Tax=Deinococcus radiophilus TaxID=32062 RepID=A0A431W208_9DEIO|nr:DUF1963 domain-containing protein [Deinococcus radiophilus]RTR29473.1 DUF1963 domain-containing protein [Deinococcus radiophilus]UFA50693.1 DUF1963 domain-containing protein [Deinococcus radiophilus]
MRPLLLLALPLCAALTVAGATWGAAPSAPARDIPTREVTMTTLPQPHPAPDEVQLWADPASGERLTLTRRGEQITVTQNGQTRAVSPDDYAEQVRQQTEMAEAMFQQQDFYSPMTVAMYRQQVFYKAGESLDAARAVWQEQGLPLALWDELEEVRQGPLAALLGMGTLPLVSQEQIAASVYMSELANQAGAGSLTQAEDGGSFEVVQDGRRSVIKVAPDSLLFHPPQELRGRFNALMRASVVTAPPEPLTDGLMHDTARQWQEQGLVQLTPRREDGAVWLPAELEPYRAALTAGERPVVRLSADLSRRPQPWQSRVGGVPYWPQDEAWPMSREADPRPLVFLAQLNLAELNAKGYWPELPRQGLLQFFILNTDLYGADFDRDWAESIGHRVIYRPEVRQDMAGLRREIVQPQLSEHSLGLDDLEGFETPFKQWPTEVALTALPDTEPVSGSDALSHALLKLPDNYWEDDDASEKLSALYETFPAGHKLGGYPNFTQSDPRQPDGEWVLLFQLDSDPRLGLMWGDVGIGNFFIRPDDLKNLDFSRVAYHWDCS